MLFDAVSLCLWLLSLFGLNNDHLTTVIKAPLAHMPRPVADGIRIGWDRQTMVRVSAPNLRRAGYARMIELRDGALLCVYEGDGSILATRSEDKGKTWREAVPVAWHQDGINMAAPDVIQLADGSLLCCYNPRPWKISGTRTFGIRTRKSYDGGKTWIHGRLVYEAGHKFGDGCWEPSAIQLPGGEIQLYFANEGVFRTSAEQNISMVSSTDGGLTWSDKPKVVSFRPGARDGMPAPLLLNSGDEIVCAIEDLRWLGHFKPAILRTPTNEPWPAPIGALHPNRTAALAEPIPTHLYAGAPYLRQLRTGETLLSYQGTEDRRNNLHNADMKVVIGNSSARSFNRKSVPFDVPPHRFALWNSITVLDDQTVIAVTSTNAFSFMNSEVWMIKGHIIPEVYAENHTFSIDGYNNEAAWAGPTPLFTRRDGSSRYRGGVAHDDAHLYFFSQIADPQVHTESAEPENNDGLTIALDVVTTEGRAATRPAITSYKFFLSADNVLVAKRGHEGRWAYNSIDDSAIKHASRITDRGYMQELAIPWSVIDGKPPAGHRIGLNVSLTENAGENTPVYRESLSGNHEDKPYTWLTLRLR